MVLRTLILRLNPTPAITRVENEMQAISSINPPGISRIFLRLLDHASSLQHGDRLANVQTWVQMLNLVGPAPNDLIDRLHKNYAYLLQQRYALVEQHFAKQALFLVLIEYKRIEHIYTALHKHRLLIRLIDHIMVAVFYLIILSTQLKIFHRSMQLQTRKTLPTASNGMSKVSVPLLWYLLVVKIKQLDEVSAEQRALAQQQRTQATTTSQQEQNLERTLRTLENPSTPRSAPGTYSVRIENGNFPSYTTSLTVNPGQITTISHGFRR